MYRFLFKILVFTAAMFCFSPNMSLAQFTPDVPFDDAVPAILDEMTTAVGNVSNLNDIGAWADQTQQRLPELLDELVAAVTSFSNQPFQDNTLGDLLLLSEKWNSVVVQYPDLAGVAVLVEPILDQAIAGLPTVRQHRQGDSPFQNFFEFYRAMEIQNPWGVSAFFQLEPLPASTRVLALIENARKQTVQGFEDTFVFKSETTVTVNNEVVFHELILDNELVKHFKKTVDVTLVHEILNQVKRDGLDPSLVAAIQALVDLIDFHLMEAQNNGLVIANAAATVAATSPVTVNQPAVTQFLENLFSSARFEHLTHQFTEAIPLDTRGVATQAQAKRAYHQTVETVPVTQSTKQIVTKKPLTKRVQTRTYESGVLEEYDKSADNISQIWLSAIFFPIFIVILIQFIRFALSPTVALLRRRPDMYIR